MNSNKFIKIPLQVESSCRYSEYTIGNGIIVFQRTNCFDIEWNHCLCLWKAHFFSLVSTFFIWKALFFFSLRFMFLDFIVFIYRILIKRNLVSFKVRISNSLLLIKKRRFQNSLFLIKNLKMSLFCSSKFIIFIFKTHYIYIFIFKIHVVSMQFSKILDTDFPSKNADKMHLLSN